MGVSSSESHDLTAFYEMLSASFGVLSQNTGFYPSLDRIIETTLGPLNLGPGGGSYNKPISRLQHTALWVRDATRDIDQLIGVALKQMMLNVNVEVVCNFGTVLRPIPYYMLEIHDFYRSIRSFYIRLMDQLVNKYKTNNPFVINIAHSFESFLQVCNYLEPLPGGYVQFTAMMAAIIRNIYNINLDELKAAAHEAKGEPKITEVEAGPSTQAVESQGKPELSREKLKAVIKKVHRKAICEEKKKEDAFYMSKAERVLERMGSESSMDPRVRAPLVGAMRKDEWEMHPGKFKWPDEQKDEQKDGKKERGSSCK